MENKKAPAIFRIIQEMDGNERGYFIKFSKMLGKGNSYMELFNILSSMEEYNPEELISKIENTNTSKNLSVSLHHLYQYVLRSLRFYHEKNRPREEVRNLLSEAELLQEKGLEDMAEKLLKKAWKKAKALHYYPLLFEIQIILIRRTVATLKVKIIETIEKDYENMLAMHKVFEEELQIRRLQHLMLIYSRMAKEKIPVKDRNILQGITEHPLLLNKLESNSFYAKYYKENIRATEAFIYKDRGAAHIYFSKMLRIWEKHPIIINAEPVLYKINISNYLVNAILLKKADDYHVQMNKLQRIPAKSVKEKIEFFQNTILLGLLYFLNYKKLDEGLKHMDKTRSQLSRYAQRMNPSRLLTVWYNYFVLCFLSDQYSDALDWVNLILYDTRAELRKDMKAACQLLSLIVHYELGNEQLLDGLIESVWRKRKESPLPIKFTKCFFAHFKPLVYSYSKKEKKSISLNFKTDLIGLKQEGIRFFAQEELSYWINAKINGTSIKEEFMKGSSL